MPEQPTAARWQKLMSLLEPVHDQVRGTARRLARDPADGDDLFQEALLRAYHKLDGLRDPSRFRSWFYAVLLSVHRNRARRGFWRRFLSLESERLQGFDPAAPAAPDREDERRRAERVSRALATLPVVQREAVVLFELEEFSIEEIADLQRVSLSAVKSRLQRGRERLRRTYERWGLAAAGSRSSLQPNPGSTPRPNPGSAPPMSPRSTPRPGSQSHPHPIPGAALASLRPATQPSARSEGEKP